MSKIGKETDMGQFALEHMGEKQGKIYVWLRGPGIECLVRRDEKDADIYWFLLQDGKTQEETSKFIKGYSPANCRGSLEHKSTGNGRVKEIACHVKNVFKHEYFSILHLTAPERFH